MSAEDQAQPTKRDASGVAPIIHYINVSKSFVKDGQAVSALGGIDLAIPHGKFVSIVGPSGCGKSTLLNLTAGLDRADSGRVPSSLAVLDRTRRAFRPGSRMNGVASAGNKAGSAAVSAAIRAGKMPALPAGVCQGHFRRRDYGE